MNEVFERNERLSVAVHDNDVDAVRKLLSEGADPNWRDILSGYTPLHAAAVAGHLAIVKTLVEAGANVNHSNNVVGETPLMQAIGAGRTSVVNYLISLPIE